MRFSPVNVSDDTNKSMYIYMHAHICRKPSREKKLTPRIHIGHIHAFHDDSQKPHGEIVVGDTADT